MVHEPPRIVWIADDSPLEAEVVGRILSPHFEVELFADGASLIERAQQSPPPLLVLDWQMPGMTGIEVCRFLRAQPSTAEVGILIITAVHPRTSDVVHALNSGANDYLVKPFVDGELLARVQAMFRAQERRARATQASTMVRLLIEQLPDPLLAVDAEGRLSFANAEAERLFGWSGKAEGKLLAELVPALAAAELTQTSAPGAITVPVGDRLFLPAVRQVSLGEGPPLVTISLRDITEHVRHEKSARKEREELIVALERSNNDLDQFARVASHDLRAPLRGIANLAQWIQEDLGAAGSKETLQHLKMLQLRVARMDALINDILAFARVGRDPEKIEAVDVGPLLREGIELLNLPRTVKVEVAAGMPTALRTERTLLQQVFLNLIGNAVKHAGREDVEVRVGATEGDETWEFTVTDNGQGIAKELQNAIWDAFRTLESREKVEGTGLGLSIVKKIVERNGGRAWVESEKGHGATFHVIWPKQPRE